MSGMPEVTGWQIWPTSGTALYARMANVSVSSSTILHTETDVSEGAIQERIRQYEAGDPAYSETQRKGLRRRKSNLAACKRHAAG